MKYIYQLFIILVVTFVGELLHYFMLDDLVNGLDLKLDEQCLYFCVQRL